MILIYFKFSQKLEPLKPFHAVNYTIFGSKKETVKKKKEVLKREREKDKTHSDEPFLNSHPLYTNLYTINLP